MKSKMPGPKNGDSMAFWFETWWDLCTAVTWKPPGKFLQKRWVHALALLPCLSCVTNSPLQLSSSIKEG